ncbi:MAG: hypothetical protein KDD56_06505 [Bdellovibrionales bacterium]|nr:hypothetical protein [Bdellovibrionales bacterium]
MEDKLELKEFAYYLEHIKDLYPFGIGDSFFEDLSTDSSSVDEAIDFVWGSGQVGVCFVVSLSPWKTHPFESSAGQLLHAAISKGMKLMPEHVSIVDCSRMSDTKENLCLTIADRMPEISIILGDQTAERFLPLDFKKTRGELLSYQGKDFIITHSLEEVSSSPNLKKEFWGHLKIVMSKMGVNFA